jgi:LAS superfamily LD-carboxypeptidase LdcB
METSHAHTQKFIHVSMAVAILLCLGALGYGVYAYISLHKSSEKLAQTLDATQEAFEHTQRGYESQSVYVAELEQKFALSQESNAELLAMLDDEQSKNEEFEDQIQEITGTVDMLDKLSKIDPELLAKYSKIYFLNEHYVPEKVRPIDSGFVKNNDGMPEYIHARVEPFLEDLLEDAKDDSIDLLIKSAYRSYDEQAGLKSSYSVQYGTGANTFSADQGYSEHQLGTTVDFTSTEVGGGLTGFHTTEAYAWLLKNAHKYGFTLSYPEGNNYYVYEPWHWRFVGEKLADDLHDDNKHFYDLEQRDIDTYLITLFD